MTHRSRLMRAVRECATLTELREAVVEVACDLEESARDTEPSPPPWHQGTREISLSRGMFAIVDARDFDHPQRTIPCPPPVYDHEREPGAPPTPLTLPPPPTLRSLTYGLQIAD